MKSLFRSLLSVVLVLTTTASYAQKKAPKGWHLMSPSKNKIYGIDLEEAYQLLKDKKPDTIIVAVIDGGVDTEHEDLKGVIWTNKKEIPDNGIDDDKNGYVDDIHGWSFIGGKSDDINYESYEVYRVYTKLKASYKGKDTVSASARNSEEFKYFKRVEAEYLKEIYKFQIQYQNAKLFDDFIRSVKIRSGGTFSKQALDALEPRNGLEKLLKSYIYKDFSSGKTAEEIEKDFKETRTMYDYMLEWNTMNADSMRQAIVGDDPNDTINRFYGCNRVKGPDSHHGTHVAGIIAAIRGNNIGMDGIASNVLIMPVRAVPNGDERDKDIANAIRYAVDNGAKIINMSFGKYYSPNKGMIDEAIKYAESKDVLLIHAAGNDAKNNDTVLSFPHRESKGKVLVNNWILVGASAYKPGKNLIGDFSNYGATKVDLFAPGVDIYSTTPENKYDTYSGTSMAAPVVAGVAALIRGYYPNLSAKEVRELLMKTVLTYNKPVILPGTKKTKKKVSELCISGGFINVKNAITELMR